MIAFTDSNGGYYQVDAPEGFVPDWAKNMTICTVLPSVVPDPKDLIRAQIRAREALIADDQARMNRIVSLEVTLDRAYTLRPAPEMTREQVHAALMAMNNGYARLYAKEQLIASLRVQL